jgi:hypothetical protein
LAAIGADETAARVERFLGQVFPGGCSHRGRCSACSRFESGR